MGAEGNGQPPIFLTPKLNITIKNQPDTSGTGLAAMWLEVCPMRRLLEMCEVVKKQGITANGEFINDSAFWDFIEECQPFVFSLRGETLEAPEVKDENGETIDVPFDAPFKVFSIEMLDGLVTVPEHGADMPTSVHCIVVVEYEPRDYVYYTHLTTVLNGETLNVVLKTDELDGLAVKFIERMNREKCGTEKIRERVKIGVGKSKRTVTFRKIVHVRPKKIFDSKDLESFSGRQIEWTHRWWRRGHWRKIDGLGKDRAGIYRVAGQTWVTEHTAGGQDAPLISKVRVVD